MLDSWPRVSNSRHWSQGSHLGMGAGRAAVGSCGPEGRHLVQPGGMSSRGDDRLLASEAGEEGSDNISALDTEVRGRGHSQVWGSPRGWVGNSLNLVLQLQGVWCGI